MVTFRSLALAASLICAGPAVAQTGQDPTGAQAPVPPQPGMMGRGMLGQGQMGPGGMMPMMNMMMRGRGGAEHIEGRLAYIKAELKITDPQAPQWNAFADATRSNAKSMAEMRDAMMARQGAPGTLPERLALEDKAVTAHLAALKKTTDAVTKLYGVLSDDQKKIADSIIVGPMGMLMGMM